MALADVVAGLSVEIETVERDRLVLDVSPEFQRVTTVVRLGGSGERSGRRTSASARRSAVASGR